VDRRTATGLMLAVAAYASWGLLSPVAKHLLDDFEPMGLNAVRFALATLVALPWLGRRGLREGLALLKRPEILWLNFLANLSLSLFIFSLVRLPPTFSTLGFYSAPLWTAALAHFALKEHAGRWFVPAFVGLLGGGYLALFGLGLPGPGFNGWRMTMAVGSAIVWAVYTVQLRKYAPGIGLKPLMGSGFVFGTIFYAASALIMEGPPRLVGHGLDTWGWLGVHVLFPTLLAFILFNAALQRAPAGQVNILIALELAFTVLFSFLLFGDRFTFAQLTGLAIALSAVSAYLWVQDREARGLANPAASPQQPAP
jgi:drug/metabolite transporter (DMT)-like permease